jgi:GT2 family glycosyltransferase
MKPIISIVMPYYMRQQLLDQGLASIHGQYGRGGLNYEIVVCDDGSPVPVKAPGCRVVSLPVKHHALNPCVPINRAVAASIGNVIVLTNPEIEHRSPVLVEMLPELRHESDYVIAACKDAQSGKWLCASHVAAGQDGRGPMPAGSGFHFCVMLRRTLFERAGGFDEEYRHGYCFDDNDWLFRLKQAGARFKMRDDLVVWHHRTAERPQWPAGGWERNRRLFEAKWLGSLSRVGGGG